MHIKLVKCIKEQENPNYFIGLKEEYDALIGENNLTENEIIFYGDKVTDLYDMALMIKKCDKFYCNPSVGMTLALGMFKEYNLVVSDDTKKNVPTGLSIENILK